jgi:hypothetical protein
MQQEFDRPALSEIERAMSHARALRAQHVCGIIANGMRSLRDRCSAVVLAIAGYGGQSAAQRHPGASDLQVK